MARPRLVQPLRVAWFKIPLGIVTDSTRHSHQFHSLWLKIPLRVALNSPSCGSKIPSVWLKIPLRQVWLAQYARVEKVPHANASSRPEPSSGSRDKSSSPTSTGQAQRKSTKFGLRLSFVKGTSTTSKEYDLYSSGICTVTVPLTGSANVLIAGVVSSFR